MRPEKPAGRLERQPADEFERRYGRFGDRERREFALLEPEVRDSGAGTGEFTIVGHAAVFRMWSLDLGFFRERLLPGAFDDVLSRNPDVWHLWDHDTRLVLSRTRNKSLELSIDPRGLRMWSRVAPTSYAADLRLLMERGDIDQSSFAFTVAADEWRIISDDDGEERIERDIVQVGELYDVTTTAIGAYPQTDSQVAGARVAAYASRQLPELPETLSRLLAGAAPAETDPAGEATSRQQAGEQPPITAPAEIDPADDEANALTALRAHSRATAQNAREDYLRLLKEITR